MAKKGYRVADATIRETGSTNKLYVFNVFNKLTGDRTIFFSPNKVMALKTFQKTINANAFNDPADYTLEYAGEWDKQTGLLSPVENIEVIAVGYWEKAIDDELGALIKDIAATRMEELLSKHKINWDKIKGKDTKEETKEHEVETTLDIGDAK